MVLGALGSNLGLPTPDPVPGVEGVPVPGVLGVEGVCVPGAPGVLGAQASPIVAPPKFLRIRFLFFLLLALLAADDEATGFLRSSFTGNSILPKIFGPSSFSTFVS